MTDTAMNPAPKENGWAMSCHLLSFLGLLSQAIPFVGSFVPAAAVLFVWFLKKDTDPEVNQHGRHSLNWQLTVFVVMTAAVFPILGVMGYQMNQQKMKDEASKAAYHQKIDAAKTMEERDKIESERSQEVAQGAQPPGSYVFLMALMSVLVIVIVVVYFIYVVRNAIRAFRGREAVYPFAIPLFATNGRRGLIK